MLDLPELRVLACGRYEGALRCAILALKDGRRDVAESLGTLLAGLLVADGPLVLPVPTSQRRARVRGIDGVGLMADIAAMRRGARVLRALTLDADDAQRGRDRARRLAARGRFGCARLLGSPQVVLVDDVCTTGATLLDCARAARAAGANVTHAVVVAAA